MRDYKKNKLILSVLIALLLLLSCTDSSDDEAPEIAPQKPPIRVSGVTDFGRVRVDFGMYSNVIIENRENSIKNISITGLGIEGVDSFYRSGGDCGITLDPGSTCSIEITFSPISPGIHSAIIGINGTNFNFQGEGVPLGDFYIIPSEWSVGENTVGTPLNQDFTIVNQGANSIPMPVVNDDRFTIVSTTCDSTIPANSNCDMNIRYSETQSGVVDFDLDILFQLIGEYPVVIEGVFNPGPPSGTIQFSNVPAFISIEDEQDTTLEISLVGDSFNNPVEDGTYVQASIVNGEFVGPSTFETVNGQGSLIIRSISQSGDVEVELSSGEAVGMIRIEARPGPAFGEISFENFTNFIRADGNSQITVQTNEILDENGNTIANGDDIYFWISDSTGDSGLDGVITPEITQSFNGRAFFQYRSGTLAQTITVNAGAAPVFAEDTGEILSFRASGSSTIELYPNIPFGDFDISCDVDDIYFLPIEPSDHANCEIGPITDAFGNFVGEGASVQVTLLNALSDTSGSGVSNFAITTDPDSIARFSLYGIGVRDWITISAISGGEVVDHQIFSVGEIDKTYASGGGGVSIFYKKRDSRFVTSEPTDLTPGDEWVKYTGDRSVLNSVNFRGIGFKTYSGPPRLLRNDLPYFTWECFLEMSVGVMISPCGVILDDEETGTTSLGGSNAFYFGVDGGDRSFEITNIGSNLASSGAHGVSDIYFPNIGYNTSSDMVYISGGATPVGVSGNYSLDRINVSSFYGFPSGIKNQFNQMNYSKEEHSINLILRSGAQIKGESYFFGGINPSTLTPSNLIHRIVYDEEETSNKFSFRAVEVSDGENGHPSPRYESGMFYSESYIGGVEKNELFIVGGWRYDAILEDWVVVDDIWRISTLEPEWEWDLVCSPCGLPSVNPIHPVYFIENDIPGIIDRKDVSDLFWARSGYQSFYKNDLERAILKPRGIGEVYSLDIINGDTEEKNGELASMLIESDDFSINQSTGKVFSYKRGDRDNFNSESYFYDTSLGKKQYYRIELQLEDLAHEYFREAHVKIYGMAKSRTRSVSSFLNDAVGYGLNAYVYNNLTQSYDFMGGNSVTTTIDTPNFPIAFNLTSRDYVSDDDKINIIITSSRETGYQFANETPQSGVSEVFLNHVFFNGIY